MAASWADAAAARRQAHSEKCRDKRVKFMVSLYVQKYNGSQENYFNAANRFFRQTHDNEPEICHSWDRNKSIERNFLRDKTKPITSVSRSDTCLNGLGFPLWWKITT